MTEEKLREAEEQFQKGLIDAPAWVKIYNEYIEQKTTQKHSFAERTYFGGNYEN